MQEAFDLIKDAFQESNFTIEKQLPSWVQAYPEPEIEVLNTEIRGGVCFILKDEQHYHSEGQLALFKRYIVQPINMNGVEDVSKFSIEFSKESDFIRIHGISVRRNNEVLDKVNTSEFHVLRREDELDRNILTGNFTLSILLEDIKENDVIEYSYTLQHARKENDTFFNKFLTLDYHFPLHQLRYTIVSTEELIYRFHGDEYPIECKHINNQYVYSVNIKDHAAKLSDDNLPLWKSKLTKFQICNKKSWQEVAAHVASLYKVAPITNSKLKEFIYKNRNTSDEDYILSSINLINKNIRYLSNFNMSGAVSPGDPNILFEKGYGDCKDFVFLMMNILAERSIKSVPVLVNTECRSVIACLLPTLAAFDHVIIKFEVGGESYYFDPTIRQELTSIKNNYITKFEKGLICDKDSKDLSAINNKHQVYEVSDIYYS